MGDIETKDIPINSSEHLDMINKVCLKRSFLVKMATHLFFDTTILGCLVKVTFNSEGNKIDYKVGTITEVIEKPELYKVDSKQLGKYLKVRIGDEIKELKIQFISNKSLDERELYKWIEEIVRINGKEAIPTLLQIEDLYNSVKDTFSKKYTSEHIKNILEEKNRQRLRSENDPKEKKMILENQLADIQRDYFDRPTQDKKEQIRRLKADIKRIEKVIKMKSGKSSASRLPNSKQRSELYGFGKHKGKIGDAKNDIHARKIANPMNLWSINEQQLT